MYLPPYDKYSFGGVVLGSGSYGEVSIVTGTNDEEAKHFALKECFQKEYSLGIIGLIEPVLLMSVNHPHLGSGIDAKVDAKCGYYVQRLALRNMYRHRKKGLSMDVRTYSHSLSQAVKVLHSLHVVHGDIKTSNIVIYDDNTVALIDYSLSFIMKERTEYLHQMCTGNYRPPEVVLQKGWTSKIDIWCLGCCFYEMKYGKYFAPPQTGDINHDDAMSRKQMINFFADWNDVLHRKYGVQLYPISRQDEEYIPLDLHPDFFDVENELFNDLLINMLAIDPSRRFTINMVLQHPYFSGMVSTDASVRRVIKSQIESPEYNRIIRYLELCQSPSYLMQKVVDLYCKIKPIGVDTLIFTTSLELEEVKVRACSLIICKLHKEKTESKPVEDVLRMEREICNFLHFLLL